VSCRAVLSSLVCCVALLGCNPVLQSENSPVIEDETLQPDYQLYLQDLSKRHLVPGYQKLAEQARGLSLVVRQTCTSPDVQPWSKAQLAWGELMQAWQRVKWMQLGPVSEQSRHQRLQYWPDGNDAVGRGLQKLLLQHPAPGVERLAQINVGAQGLPALEQLLFSTQAAAGIEWRHQCAVAKVIAQNIQQMTTEIYQEWLNSEFKQQLVTGSGEFTGSKDAVEELVSNWLAQLIILLDNRLTYPLSVASPGIPALAESAYSDVSMYSIRTNLVTFKQIFTGAGGYGMDDILIQQGQGALAQQVLSALDQSIELGETLPDSFTQAMADEQQWQRMKQLITELKALQKLLAEGVLMQLQLNIGFNALDGD